MERYRCPTGHVIQTAGVPVKWCPYCGLSCEKLVRLGQRPGDEPRLISEPDQT